jgi:carbon starvation protein
VVLNDRIDAGLALLFMGVVLLTALLGLRAALRASRSATPTAQETPYVAAPLR